ncbi:cytochrome b5-related protein isoform X2 [Pseudomyrmex gracilis]|uniref:cytochrome b5-related protein isoform X2 n=1 Tax=Pseudomyrmex gracilis TaxID=219809 RepID=UPI000994D678|nr:cytochrome b5-related protein isoform X2 [Pseudomyrmex gracilis]XP_020287164.1 cytochrome b5-related protein isoform X2 [Pseudomyrmex gracilis]
MDTLRNEIKKTFGMSKTSTVPGLAYLPARNKEPKTAAQFLQSRRTIDGAEGLWRIENKLYDLETFAKSHPGGSEWIRLTKGTDITELFESHHITDKAERLLPKFFVREVTTPRSVPLTFLPDGFYRKFKKRAAEALKNVDFHRPSVVTNLIADSLAIVTFALSFAAAFVHSYAVIIPASLFLTWTVIAGHNYFHMRDNFRMYYFDLGMISSKNWRITHVMSHHMYTNTMWDYEIYVVEPFLQWLPRENKSYLAGMISKLISPIVWILLSSVEGIKRYYAVFMEFGIIEFRDFVPLLLPLSMSLIAPNVFVGIKLWLLMMVLSSFFFGLIGFNAAHHHPDIFHDGDIYRNDMDWGLLEMDSVRDREVIDDSTFLALTHFGSHTLHHLLPTVDHYYLSLCMPAFLETCKEFNISTEKWTQWKLLKGQFKQLARCNVKENHR